MYRMNFDLKTKTGTVVMNVSVIGRRDLTRSIPLIQRVFSSGYAMGKLMNLYPPGTNLSSSGSPTMPWESERSVR